MSRRRPGARWAGSFSMTVVSADGSTFPLRRDLTDDELLTALRSQAGRVQFRFRFEGRQRSPSVPLADGHAAVVDFRRTLLAAIAGDWDLDASGRPVAPGADPDPHIAEEPQDAWAADDGDADVVDLFTRRPALLSAPQPGGEAPLDPGAVGGGGALIGTGRSRMSQLAEPAAPVRTFDDLRTWQSTELAETRAKSKPTKRLANTLGNADGELRFAAAYFRCGAGELVRSRPVDGEGGIDEDDCVDFLLYRKHTNLGTRVRNERHLDAWARTVETAIDVSALPAPPMDVEVAEVRTIKAAAVTVGRAFRNALIEHRIPVNPWTARVDARVESPARTHHTQKPLPDPDQIRSLIDALRTLERTTVLDGRALTVTGERYAMFVELTERLHLRPEEARALRRSSLRDDPQLGRHLVISESIVFVSSRFTADGQAMQVQGLKARAEGDVRIFYVDDSFFGRVEDHLARFVPAGDPSSADRDVADPLMFTTHGGAVIAPGPFNERWWSPAVEAAARSAPVLAGFRFRQLRHTGITRRLLQGDSIEDIADDAGNSPEVIRSSYRGVIDALERKGRPRTRPGAGRDLAALADPSLGTDEVSSLLASLDDERLESLHCNIRAERGIRSDD